MNANLQIACVGDVHLKQDGKRDQRLSAWDQIIAHGFELPRLGAWLCLGDLFDAKSTAADRNDAARRLQAMANVAPVVLLRGNHDGEGELSVFGRLKATHPITVVEHPDTIRLVTPYGRVALACLPYPFKGTLAAMGLSPDEVMRAADGALLDICRELRAELAEAEDQGAALLFAAHVNISGALTSAGQPNVGHEISLTKEHLDLFAGMPRLLGHIHKAQEIHGGIYAGSIARMSFGETEEKRALIVALGPAPGQYQVSSRTLDVPPMYHVEGELTRAGFSYGVINTPGGESLAGNWPAIGTWEGSEVRVRYRFAQSEQRLLDHGLASAPFAGATLKLEPIAVPDRALRAPDVVQATTLADKIAAWATLTETVASAAVLEKLARLQTQDEATLRAGIEAWLAQAEGELAREQGVAA